MLKYLIFIVGFFNLIPLCAQTENSQKYFIGIYYSFFIDLIYIPGTTDSFSLQSHSIDVNFRYALNRAWKVGAEYILTTMAGDQLDDPFSTFGLTLDYNVLRAKKSKLLVRAGLSFSNLSKTSDGFPQKRLVINRLLGASYEYRISNVLWINGGFYHHYPLNKIEFKEPMVLPFVGVAVGI